VYPHHITISSGLAEIIVKGLSRENHSLNDCYARNVDEVQNKALSEGKDPDEAEQVYKEHLAKIDEATVTAEVKQVIRLLKEGFQENDRWKRPRKGSTTGFCHNATQVMAWKIRLSKQKQDGLKEIRDYIKVGSQA
jgi:hypothetical protein